MDNKDKMSVQLDGGLPHTATWVKIKINGDFVVDFYDYSDDAQDFFGNDVAYLLIIATEHKPQVAGLLGLAAVADMSQDERDMEMLNALQARFSSYFEVQEWLLATNVEFTKEFDSWA